MFDTGFILQVLENVSLGLVIRCLVPLVLMLGASQVLRHYQLIAKSSSKPSK